MKRRILTITSLILLTVFSSGSTCIAEEEKKGFDKAWNYMNLYGDKENSVIQKFAFVGRLQLDNVWVYANLPDDYGNNDEDTPDENWNDLIWRRARFGFKADLFQDWTAHIEGDFKLNNDIDDMYNKLTDAYISWQPNKTLKITTLKHSAGFTMDGKTSSKSLLVLERNNLTNNLWFTEEYFTGLSASGKMPIGLSYFAGGFSSGGDPEWDFDTASYFGLLNFGYKIGGADIGLDYVYQDKDENANTRDFEHIFSLSCKWDSGSSWGVNGEMAGGIGFEDMGQSDVRGLVIQPYYDLSKYTQLVAQYTYLTSEDDNGLRLNKYDNKIINDKGDDYYDVYLGFNVYFYGHKFKWQTGVTYARMDDAANDGGEYEGWTLSTGLRLSW